MGVYYVTFRFFAGSMFDNRRTAEKVGESFTMTICIVKYQYCWKIFLKMVFNRAGCKDYTAFLGSQGSGPAEFIFGRMHDNFDKYSNSSVRLEYAALNSDFEYKLIASARYFRGIFSS